MTECATCKNIRKLYVPPVHKDVPQDAYVCLLFEAEGQVMYMSSNSGMCEMYQESKGEERG